MLVGLTAQAAAAACVAVAYAKRDAVVVEGAYFNRSVSGDAAVVAISGDIGPWLIAALVLLIVGTSVAALALVRARRSHLRLRGTRDIHDHGRDDA
jgi:hypothetical protein